MKKISISGKPWWVIGIPVIVCAAAFLLMLIAGLIGNDIFFAVTMIFMGISFVFLIIGELNATMTETEVSFGEGSIIKCEWSFYKWEIDMEQVKSVYYTISSHADRYKKWHTIDIVFEFGDESVKALKDEIESEDMGKFVTGKAKEVELMKLYEYISSAYPEKAVGFKESAELN
ncbi:MAG: hypothetical protein IJN43_09350 [Ruminococcus sp.]|nr:hypothetical protein [Ruminococcus sp.]